MTRKLHTGAYFTGFYRSFEHLPSRQASKNFYWLVRLFFQFLDVLQMPSHDMRRELPFWKIQGRRSIRYNEENCFLRENLDKSYLRTCFNSDSFPFKTLVIGPKIGTFTWFNLIELSKEVSLVRFRKQKKKSVYLDRGLIHVGFLDRLNTPW